MNLIRGLPCLSSYGIAAFPLYLDAQVNYVSVSAKALLTAPCRNVGRTRCYTFRARPCNVARLITL